jgi:ectoine hydroxylase-related dioxygenase (phytanoyl-CoA dioxygenase family)
MLTQLNDQGFWIAKGVVPNRILTEIAERTDSYFQRDHERFGSSFLAEINESEHLRNAPEYDYIFIELLAASAALDEIIAESLHKKANIHNYNLIRLTANSHSDMLGHQWHWDVFFFGPRIRTAINVLIPLQDTSSINGATEVLPGSHGYKDLPGIRTIESQMRAPNLVLGDALILDAATFHKAGTNSTQVPRTIISLKYTLSFFTQQYDFCRCLPVESYPDFVRDRLGYQVRVPENLEQFRVRRDQRRYPWSIRE